MPSERSDERLRELVRTLQEINRVKTPPFSQIWQQAIASQGRPRRLLPIWAPAALAVSVVGIAAFVTLLYLPPWSESPSAHTELLAQWQSPTAALLAYPGQELFQDLPELGRSLVSYSHTEPI